MSNTFTHRVLYSDGSEITVDWTVRPILAIHAERQFNRPITPMLIEDYLEVYFFGVWWTLKHEGKTPLGYEKWLEIVEECSMVAAPNAGGTEVEVDPKPETARKGARKSSSSTGSSEQPSP